MLNLIDVLNNKFTNNTLQTISSKTGISTQNINKGVGMGIPATVAYLKNLTRTPSGAQYFFSLLKENDHIDLNYKDINNVFGNDSYKEESNTLIDQVFRDNKNSFLDNFSENTNLDIKESKKFLGYSLYPILGLLNKKRLQNDLDPSEIADLLNLKDKTFSNLLGEGFFNKITKLDFDGYSHHLDDSGDTEDFTATSSRNMSIVKTAASNVVGSNAVSKASATKRKRTRHRKNRKEGKVMKALNKKVTTKHVLNKAKDKIAHTKKHNYFNDLIIGFTTLVLLLSLLLMLLTDKASFSNFGGLKKVTANRSNITQNIVNTSQNAVIPEIQDRVLEKKEEIKQQMQEVVEPPVKQANNTPMMIEISSLIQEFNQDASAAQQKYLGKQLIFKGNVNEVIANQKMADNIVFSDLNNTQDILRCFVDPRLSKEAGSWFDTVAQKAQMGDTRNAFSVTGTLDSKILNTVIFKNCSNYVERQ